MKQALIALTRLHLARKHDQERGFYPRTYNAGNRVGQTGIAGTMAKLIPLHRFEDVSKEVTHILTKGTGLWEPSILSDRIAQEHNSAT